MAKPEKETVFFDRHYRRRKFKCGGLDCTTENGCIRTSNAKLIDALNKQYGIERENGADADIAEQTETS